MMARALRICSGVGLRLCWSAVTAIGCRSLAEGAAGAAGFAATAFAVGAAGALWLTAAVVWAVVAGSVWLVPMLAAAAGADRPAMTANAAPAMTEWKRTRVGLSTRAARFRKTTGEIRFFRRHK